MSNWKNYYATPTELKTISEYDFYKHNTPNGV